MPPNTQTGPVLQPQPMQPTSGVIGSGPEQQFTPPTQPGTTPEQTQQSTVHVPKEILVYTEVKLLVILKRGDLRLYQKASRPIVSISTIN